MLTYPTRLNLMEQTRVSVPYIDFDEPRQSVRRTYKQLKFLAYQCILHPFAHNMACFKAE
jgi:hypothetical protein